MIHPLHLGNKIFPVNLIAGPLAGISCSAFRYLIWKYSQPAFCCTEMISCKALLYKSKISYRRYIDKNPNEGPVCFQLFGKNPDELGEATKIVTDHGADLIDLNCGCPVKKVRKQGAGSQLLTDPLNLYNLITAIKKNTHLPVSVKIRVESNAKEKFNQEIAKVVSEAGTDFLVVHGRHWNEHYDVPCHHEQIQFFVEAVKMPVIGNGDVTDLASLKKMFSTGCAGVMIARAMVGQPWLIRKLIAAINEEVYTPPSAQEIGAIFIEHVNELEKLLGSEKHAILQARQVASHYAHGLKDKKEFCSIVNSCTNLDELKATALSYFI
jgi:tRNA-dihydrouridine synthase B